MAVVYRGGSECWFEVRARGRIWRRPGYTALLDLMADIYEGNHSSRANGTDRGR